MVSYTFNASFVYVGKGSNPLKIHIIIKTFATHENTEYHHQISISGFYSVLDEIYRNKLYYFKSTKRRLSYFITHKLINLNLFSIYQLLLLYSTQIYNAFFLTLLLWNVLLRTPKFKSTKSCGLKVGSDPTRGSSIFLRLACWCSTCLRSGVQRIVY